jgi:dTDP-glucose 4,6-dehydratase
MQCLNSAAMFGTETMRIRLFNCYGPGEAYSPYRSAVCRFIYSALMDEPYQVFLGHHRTSTYVTDVCRTIANCAENFRPGEAYNIGGTEFHDMKSVSDSILRLAGKTDRLVKYVEGEPFTTKDKRIDVTKAVRDLNHAPEIALEEGLKRTIAWMRHHIENGGGERELDRFL